MPPTERSDCHDSSDPDVHFRTDPRIGTGQLLAFVLGTLVFLKERGIPIAEWVSSVARQFAPGWEQLRGQGATAVATAAALNLVSGGATLVNLSGDDRHAEAILDWPIQDFLDAFPPANRDDLDQTFGIFEVVAAHLDMRSTWHRDGDRVHLAFTK